MSNHIPPVPQLPSIRLIIVDDHVLARAGLRALLTNRAGAGDRWEAANGQEALALCRHLQSDVVLMDLRMPIMDGLTATRMIRQAYPDIKVLLLTIAGSPEYVSEARQAGAAGFLLKDVTQQELMTAIQHVLAGTPFFE